ncbi:hypothetical protein LTR28_006678 [Elasticomyces elasticus]|nr:hypothetical protein LTR28_006678 [Elasticomyces elasticus]
MSNNSSSFGGHKNKNQSSGMERMETTAPFYLPDAPPTLLTNNPFEVFTIEPSNQPDDKLEHVANVVKALRVQVKQLTDSNNQVIKNNEELARKCQLLATVNDELVRTNDQLVDRNEDLLESNARLFESSEGLVRSNEELVKSNEQLVESNRELKDRVKKLETTQSSMLSTRTGDWRAAVLSPNVSSPAEASLPTTISPNSSASQSTRRETLPGINIDLTQGGEPNVIALDSD